MCLAIAQISLGQRDKTGQDRFSEIVRFAAYRDRPIYGTDRTHPL